MTTEDIGESGSADAGTYQGGDGTVFVCYSHSDGDQVYPEIARLRAEGVNVWYDEGIALGTEWTDELAAAIEGCSSFLFYATSRSVQSRHCRDEVHYALKHEKSIVVVYLDDTDLPRGLDLALSSIQAVRRDEIEPARYLHQLLQALSPNQVIAEGVTLSRGDKVAYATPRRRRTQLIGLGVAAIALLAIGWVLLDQFRANDSPVAVTDAEEIDLVALKSIAVLPFVNMSRDPDLGFFANGIADGILDELAQAKWMRVASRTAAFQLAGEGQELQAIADELNVAYVLEGSVQRMGDQVRSIAQLIRATDGYHVWSKTYQGAYSDGFEMQEAVVNNAANIVRSKLWSDIQRQHPLAFSEYRGVKPEAVEYFLDAEEHWQLLAIGEGGDPVYYRQLLQKATEVDPNFAAAHIELAWGYAFMLDRSVAPKEAAAAAHAAIERVLELGYDQADYALYLLYLTYMNLDLDYASAEAAIREGLELDPGNPMWSWGLAYIAAAEGRVEEVQRYLATSAAAHNGGDLDPFISLLGDLQLAAGAFEKAANSYAEALDHLHAGPIRAKTLQSYAAALVMLDRIDEAKVAIADAWDTNAQYPVTFAHLYANTGEEQKARRILQQTQPTPVNAYEVALGYLALGEIDQAFESISFGITAHNNLIALTLRAAKFWDPIRGDPRFVEMLELLDAEVKHTPRFLQDHGLAAGEAS